MAQFVPYPSNLHNILYKLLKDLSNTIFHILAKIVKMIEIKRYLVERGCQGLFFTAEFCVKKVQDRGRPDIKKPLHADGAMQR